MMYLAVTFSGPNADRAPGWKAVVVTGTPFIGHSVERHQQFWAELAQMTQETTGIRGFGSSALDLAYVVAGRFDGFGERKLQPWDIAAGVVLVREAGGMADEIDGGKLLETGNVLASNLSLCQKFQNKFKDAREAS